MKKKTAKPKAVRGDAKRAALIAAARRLFLTKDYDDVSMDEIVKRAGGSKATVYKFFGTKEVLLQAVIEETGAEVARTAVPPAEVFELPLDQMLSHMIKVVMKQILSEDSMGLYRLCISVAMRMPHLGDIYFKKGGPLIGTMAWAELFRALDADGRFKVPDPELAAKILGGAALNYCTLEIMLGQRRTIPDDEIKKIADEVIRIGFAAYERKRQSPA